MEYVKKTWERLHKEFDTYQQIVSNAVFSTVTGTTFGFITPAFYDSILEGDTWRMITSGIGLLITGFCVYAGLKGVKEGVGKLKRDVNLEAKISE